MNGQQNIPSQNDSNQSSADILSEILGKLMTSQAIDVSGSTEQASEPKADQKAAEPVDAKAQNPFGDILSSLLSNPELLSKLPSMISAAKPIIDMLSQSNKEKETTVIPTASQSTGGVKDIARGENDHRAALLCAMKPYLGADRQNTIDYIIKLSRLGDILKTL